MAEENKSSKRRLKNPETFREKALKEAEQKAKPKKEHSQLKNALKAASKPIGDLIEKLRSIKALKPFFKVFSIIGRVLLPKYFRTSYQELKKVTWPTFKQSRRLTYAVLIFAIIFGASVAVVDYGLGQIFKRILLK